MPLPPTSVQLTSRQSVIFLPISDPPAPQGLMDWHHWFQLEAAWEEALLHARAVVIFGLGRHFSAGWAPEAWLDISPEVLADNIERVQRFLLRIRESRIPVVAAIHGLCQGPGMELMLACHGAVASLHSSTLLAMEERNLGLVPALGSTIHLAHILGLQSALHVLLSGRSYRHSEALEMGLVDRIVSPDQVRNEAGSLALTLSRQRKPRRRVAVSLGQQGVERLWVGRRLILRNTQSRLDEYAHDAFPVPSWILATVERGWRRGEEEGLAMARRRAVMAQQLGGTQSLLRLRRLTLDRQQYSTDNERQTDIRRMTVLGAGRMGQGMVHLARSFDLTVHLVERNPAAIQALASWAQREGCLLFDTDSFQPSQAAEFVMETVDENLARKQQVLMQAEQYLEPGGLLATNTSTLSIETLAKGLRRPDRLVGMHFFMPPGAMPLVEIIPGPETSQEAIDKARGLAAQLGKVWIQVQDHPGFFCTRVLGAYLHEALCLLEEGCDVAKVDYVLHRFGFLHGPFAFMDMIGLDLVQKVLSSVVQPRLKAQGDKPLDLPAHLMVEGWLGQKSGKGFYIHQTGNEKYLINNRVYDSLGDLHPRRLSTMRIQHRMVLALVNEAARCLQEGIIGRPEDADLGTVYGLGFPAFLGGALRYADSLGLTRLIHMLQELQQDYGPRFQPAEILQEKVELDLSFYRK